VTYFKSSTDENQEIKVRYQSTSFSKILYICRNGDIAWKPPDIRFKWKTNIQILWKTRA